MVATTPWLMCITDAGWKVTYLDGTYTATRIRKGAVVTYVGARPVRRDHGVKVLGDLRVPTRGLDYGMGVQRAAIASEFERRGWEVEWIADHGETGKNATVAAAPMPSIALDIDMNTSTGRMVAHILITVAERKGTRLARKLGLRSRSQSGIMAWSRILPRSYRFMYYG